MFPHQEKIPNLLPEVTLSSAVCYTHRGNALKDLSSSAVIPRLLATICSCTSICVWTLGEIRKRVMKVNRKEDMVLITAVRKGSKHTKWAGGLFFAC